MVYKIKNTEFFRSRLEKTGDIEKMADAEIEKEHDREETDSAKTEADLTAPPKPRGLQEEALLRAAKPLKIDASVKAIIEENGKVLRECGLFELAAQLDKVKQSADRERFTIAVTGEFSRGKSSFINKLLGKDILPVGDLPTTAVMTRIRHNPREVMAVFDESSGKKTARKLSADSWEDLKIQNFGGKDFQGFVVAGINSSWLKSSNIELIDTPGAGDLSQARAKALGDMLLGCDGAVITVSATSALSLTEKLFIEERLLTRKIPFLLLIVTKLDLVPVLERAGVIRYIKNKLKGWGMDIPVYIPYAVEMDSSEFDDITGMDKIRQKLGQWAVHPEREALAKRWLLERSANLLEQGISVLNEKKVLLDEADQEKRNDLLEEKRQKLRLAQLIWGDLRLKMQKRCTECYKLLLSRTDEYVQAITERLQYEVAHTNDPKKWWNEDFPYRIKIELTNMSVAVENYITKQIEADVHWYSASIEKTFHSCVLYEKKKIASKEMFGDFSVGENRELEDLGRARNMFRIGAAVLSISGFALLSSVGFLPIIASIGIGTGSSIVSESIFRKKIEAQRESLKREIARCVPELIQEAMQESESRLESVYNQILLEGEKTEQSWMENQKAALEKLGASSEGGQAGKLGEMIERLIQKKENICEMLYGER